MKHLLLVPALLMLLGGCKITDSSSEAPSESVSEKSHAYEKRDCQALQAPPENFDEPDFQRSHIQSMEMEGSNLLVKFQYSGCQPGEVLMAKMNSNPGKRALSVNLELRVAEAGFCEMLISDSTCFDLSGLEPPAREYHLYINQSDEALIYHP